MVRSGSATNVIPATGEVAGTVRMLDAVAWADAEALVRELIHQVIAPYGVTAEVTYLRGVPPVVNEPAATKILTAAARIAGGEDCVVPTAQSLGGEDFAWYVDTVPGAMARLGTRTPGGPTYDLHQGDLVVDERSIGVGARVLAAVALAAASA
jgi:amidohydrolase